MDSVSPHVISAVGHLSVSMATQLKGESMKKEENQSLSRRSFLTASSIAAVSSFLLSGNSKMMAEILQRISKTNHPFLSGKKCTMIGNPKEIQFGK